MDSRDTTKVGHMQGKPLYYLSNLPGDYFFKNAPYIQIQIFVTLVEAGC